MKSVIIIERISVQNANALCGLTYGFPPMSHFLGFTHALSRVVKDRLGLTFGGCAVVCHQHEFLGQKLGEVDEYSPSTYRPPANKKGEPSPFQMSASIHLSVSLIIECLFSSGQIDFGMGEDDADINEFTNFLRIQVPRFRIAGGLIRDLETIQYLSLSGDGDEQERRSKKALRKLLPGYCIVERSALLEKNLQMPREDESKRDSLDAWMEFSAIQYKCSDKPELNDSSLATAKAEWRKVARAEKGWFVPIPIGFKSISPLYLPGEVRSARDPSVPFRFVESEYGLGEWIGLHRVSDFESLMWRYEVRESTYRWRNRYEEMKDLS